MLLNRLALLLNCNNTKRFHLSRKTCDLTTLLCKIHVHCSRDNTIVPPISPVTPIIGQPPLDIINHALKKMHFPPRVRCRLVRRPRIPVRSIGQATGKSVPQSPLWLVGWYRTGIMRAGYLINREFSTHGRVLFAESRHCGCGLYFGLSMEAIQ